MKRILLVLAMVLVVGIASATIDFQAPSDAELMNATNCTTFCGNQPNPFYVANVSGGNAYFDNGAGGSMVATAQTTTYWAATIKRISVVGGGYIRVALLDENYGALDTINTPTIDVGVPHRYEVNIVSGVPYLYIDGIWKYNKTSAMTKNPSYIWVYSTYNSGYAEHSVDDITYGESDSKTVLGLPETGAYYIKNDMVNPAASGFYNATTGGLISSNYVSTTFSRSNLSGNVGNESIYLINQYTGTVYETKYTGSACTGTVYWDVGSSLISAGAPYGWYQIKLNTTLSEERLSLIANGANIYFDADEYSQGDSATVTYLVDSDYWIPGEYTYRIDIVDVYGTVHHTENIATSSGDVTFTWDTTEDTQGVYYAEIIADRITDGEDILLNYDYATLTATFGFNGYVNAAQTALPIGAANVTYAQGDTMVNTSSGFDGNYSALGFLTGIPIWSNTSATGYQTQNFTFTVQNGHTITRNITLNETAPSYTGLGIGGVCRDGIFTDPNTITNGYGRPVPSATCHLLNTTHSESYTTAGNNAGGYLFDESGSVFLTTARVYDLWCERSGYSNSPNYTVVAA